MRVTDVAVDTAAASTGSVKSRNPYRVTLSRTANPNAASPANTRSRRRQLRSPGGRAVSRASSDVVDSVTVQTTAVVNVTDSTAAGSGSTYWSARLRKMPATPKPNAADSARSGVNR